MKCDGYKITTLVILARYTEIMYMLDVNITKCNADDRKMVHFFYVLKLCKYVRWLKMILLLQNSLKFVWNQ